MKKRGFTIIELLAVIMVLAIIALIVTPIVLNVIDKMRSSVELQNARALLRTANNYIYTQRLQGNNIREEQIFVIKDGTEYQLDKLGNRTETSNFKQKTKVCDYCVIKIGADKKISILYEGKKQDLKKDYNSSDFLVQKLTEPREIVSSYNELVLFKDLYLKNNSIAGTKYFKTDSQTIYEIASNGIETASQKLYNSSGSGRITLTDSNNYSITIRSNEKIYEFNSTGEIDKTDNLNSEYSEGILALYEDIKFSAERYLENTSVSSEVYFEFNNGVINKVDKYGNTTKDSNMIINPNLRGSGEISINPSNQVSVVIYDTNSDIKNNYGSDELHSTPIKYSRDAKTLIKNLSRLELLAETYLGINSMKSDWLVFYYIRSLKYNSSIYDIVTGTDTDFVTYVEDNAPSLKSYFTSKNTYNANGHNIDLKHMAASLAGNIYDTNDFYHILYKEIEYDCVVSWAGDLHQLMEDYILKSGVKEQYGSYLNATYSLMGKSGTTFSMEDVHADIDAWLLYYNMKENQNLSIGEIFDKYYAGESSRSYKNRFTSFINVMTSISSSLSTNSFEGVVNHFTNTDKNWQTIDSLEIKPNDAEQKEIADGFVKWIREKAAAE